MIISKDSIITESVLQQGLAIFLDYRKTIIIAIMRLGCMRQWNKHNVTF